jgi:hypothetical protein
MKSVGRDSVEPKLDFLGKSHGPVSPYRSRRRDKASRTGH